MKKRLTLVFLLLATLVFAQNNGNYILIVNNDSIRIDLNKEVPYKINSRKELKLKLIQPDILTYADDMIAFNHDKTLSVSNSDIGDGIEQCMVMKSTGNGFMVQKYKTLDPSSLTRLMLNEITKESISYGYSKTEVPFSKTLVSGQTIEGTTATLTYRGEKEIYTVATYGEKDQGIIVITMHLTDNAKDQEIIDLFLDTLRLNQVN